MSTDTDRITAAIDDLASALGPKVRRNEPLGPYTTYRVGGCAAAFVDVTTLDDLVVIASIHAQTSVPVIVIGRGSNMLVADHGFDGIAVSLAGFADQIELPTLPGDDSGDEAGTCRVVAGGAVALPVLARRTAAASITGFEWAVGVPGSIGGAVRMNAGGHGSDMSNCLVSVTVFDFADPLTRSTDLEDANGSTGLPDGVLATHGGTKVVGVDDIGLRFRASLLPPSQVVLDATLSLRWGDAEASERELSEIVKWRRANQPGGQNCGSVFVNPVPGEVTAGALIDSIGLRGFRIGTAWVSEKHANFIQAGEGGSADDVRAVIEAVRERVAADSGYLLRSEVRLVGFDDADPMSFDEARS